MPDEAAEDVPQPSPLGDPFAAHEALDRAHLAAAFFQENVAQHVYVQAHPDLRPVAERLAEELASFYQLVGQVTLTEPAPPGK